MNQNEIIKKFIICLFRHSQDTTTPQCPQRTGKLQDGGYSFMGMQGDTYAAHQDLGKIFL
jgi:hypothetical protein